MKKQTKSKQRGLWAGIIRFLFLTVLLCLASTKASAHDIEVANSDGVTIYYVFTNDHTELEVSYRGDSSTSFSNEYSGDVVIPESVTYNGTTYPVTSIGSSAFYECSGLTSVTIPESVTTIGKTAFSKCSGLTSVTIGNSVTSIGQSAFASCSGLTNITIPNSVTSLGIYAFYECSGLTSITIPNSVSSIGKNAFDGCSGLQSVVVGNGVTSLPEYIFRTGRSLKSLTIGANVFSINSNAFSGYNPIKTIWLTDTPPSGYECAAGTNVNYVANDQYSSLSNIKKYPLLSSLLEVEGVKYVPVSQTELTCEAIDCNYSDNSGSIKLNESVSYQGADYTITCIRSYTFYDCLSLASITIPNSVTSISEYAFSGCSGLQSVVVGNGVTDLPAYVLGTGRNLKSLTIGSGVLSINNNAFTFNSEF